MALDAKVGTFGTTTGIVGNTIAVTGVGFQPKAILFWWGGTGSAIDAVGGGDYYPATRIFGE